MPDPVTLGLFGLAALTLFLVPGPAVLYVVARSVAGGRRAGFVSVLGIHTGSLVHIGAAAAGLSALVLASTTVFTTVRLLGAAYLVWLGIATWRRPASAEETGATAGRRPASLRRVYGQGVLVNVLNPKTALFFLALTPQFVDPSLGPVAGQLLVLGGVFVVLGTLSDGLYAAFGASLGRRLARSSLGERLHRRLAAVLLVVLGVGTAVAGGHGASG